MFPGFGVHLQGSGSSAVKALEFGSEGHWRAASAGTLSTALNPRRLSCINESILVAPDKGVCPTCRKRNVISALAKILQGNPV